MPLNHITRHIHSLARTLFPNKQFIHAKHGALLFVEHQQKCVFFALTLNSTKILSPIEITNKNKTNAVTFTSFVLPFYSICVGILMLNLLFLTQLDQWKWFSSWIRWKACNSQKKNKRHNWATLSAYFCFRRALIIISLLDHTNGQCDNLRIFRVLCRLYAYYHIVLDVNILSFYVLLNGMETNVDVHFFKFPQFIFAYVLLLIRFHLLLCVCSLWNVSYEIYFNLSNFSFISMVHAIRTFPLAIKSCDCHRQPVQTNCNFH